ncbi:MAG: hypothetical protein HC882_06145 [Acidobacteria bacterium]|nr:hypothetical protein [Acidobacteriota bacterium]
MTRRLWLTVLGVAIMVATASVARAQSDLRAWHADGQTWLVWTNDRAFAGLQTYDIYRSSQPIDELRRKIEVESLAFAFGAGVFGGMTYWLLVVMGTVSGTGFIYIFAAMVLIHSAGVIIGHRKYS